MVSKPVDLGLRGLQFLWTLLILALVGNMIAESIAGDPASINFAMFTAVFSMLSLFFLIASAVKGLMANSPIPLALDILNTLFFFCGAVALSAYLGVHSCNNEAYILQNQITNGSENPTKRCRESQAITAFMWFAFITYAISCFFSATNARSSGVNLRPSGIRKGGPPMSQV